MRYLFVSVLPAPDSPDTTTDCDRRSFRIRWYASSALAKTCGCCLESGLPTKWGIWPSS